VIKDFSRIRHTHEVVYSDPLIFNGLTWRLKVYPNGNGIAKGNYISIFLEMVKGHLTEPSKYEYRVEMLNHREP
jgi:tripartite motif-containing protein 37